MKHSKTQEAVLLEVHNLELDTPSGRPLFHDLNLKIAHEQIAIIGRNGSGKSTLIKALSQKISPQRGTIDYNTQPFIINQDLNNNSCTKSHLQHLVKQLCDGEMSLIDIDKEFSAIGLRTFNECVNSKEFSLGELRKIHLLSAKFKYPKLLLLDEPTQDLDKKGIHWLQQWLKKFSNGLLIVSHEQRILKHFKHFFLVSESGCSYFSGCFRELKIMLEHDELEHQKKYIHSINNLIEQEKHNIKVIQRRQRKKNRGRSCELDRMTPKMRLNKKRSYAQVSQGKMVRIRQERIKAIRAFIKATRRELSVTLPMSLLMPDLPVNDGKNVIVLNNISKTRNGYVLFQGINLKLKRHRLAFIGPNGSGKTTLLQIILQQLRPDMGELSVCSKKIGSIAQGASDWMLDDSLISYLMMSANNSSPESIARLLIGHKFPLALAERPMSTLSPGERVRAALICLLTRSPTVEFLILDEPTYSLDFVGITALNEGLKAWSGGLIIVSHDSIFLKNIGIHHYLELNENGTHQIINH